MHNFYFSNNINTKWFIFFGLILHVLASYFTVGYYNADEHYQVIGPLDKIPETDYYQCLMSLPSIFYKLESKLVPYLAPFPIRRLVMSLKVSSLK